MFYLFFLKNKGGWQVNEVVVLVTITVFFSFMVCTFQSHMKTISMFTQLLSNSVTTILLQIVLEKTEDSIHEEQN